MTMKIALLAALVGSAAAFVPSVSRTACTSLAAAQPSQEDLEKTFKVIMDNMGDDNAGIDDSDDDTPVDAPAAPAAAAPASSGVELWSVDYDAAARLAFEAAGSNGDFGAFNSKYLEDTSAMVSKKGLM